MDLPGDLIVGLCHMSTEPLLNPQDIVPSFFECGCTKIGGRVASSIRKMLNDFYVILMYLVSLCDFMGRACNSTCFCQADDACTCCGWRVPSLHTLL